MVQERHELPDGDFLDWFWLQPTMDSAPETPLLLLLHGLEGHVKSYYMQDLLWEVNRQGWRAVAMHHRNCGGVMNRLPQSYHAMRHQELAWSVQALRERFPQAPLAVVGFSISGNILLHWLGSTQTSEIDAAIAISVPYLLSPCADHLTRGWGRIYQNYLMGRLKRSALRKWDLLQPVLDLSDPDQIFCTRTLREFDNLITAPLHGFQGAADYYEQASCRQHLKGIQAPTLLIQARDDPFMPPEVIPQWEELSESTTPAFVDQGGHVGFLSGSRPGKAESWLNQIVPMYLKSLGFEEKREQESG